MKVWVLTAGELCSGWRGEPGVIHASCQSPRRRREAGSAWLPNTNSASVGEFIFSHCRREDSPSVQDVLGELQNVSCFNMKINLWIIIIYHSICIIPLEDKYVLEYNYHIVKVLVNSLGQHIKKQQHLADSSRKEGTCHPHGYDLRQPWYCFIS